MKQPKWTVVKVNKKEVDECETVQELRECLPWLDKYRPLMFIVHEPLHDILTPRCYNRNKKWSNAEKETVIRHLTDFFDPHKMAQVSAWTGRAPHAIFDVGLQRIWEIAGKDKKRILLKRVIRSAVKHGYAEWEK